MRKGRIAIANIIHVVGWIITLYLISFFVYRDFILLDVSLKVKLSFVVYMSLFILFLVFSGYINSWVKRRLQSIDTANELGQIGRTPALLVEFLNMIQIILPLLLVGAMFGVVALSLVSIGFVILKIAGLLFIPVISGTIRRTIYNKERMLLIENDKLDQAKKVADELNRRKVGYR